jgi:predicted membrane-bound spermidine synthase
MPELLVPEQLKPIASRAVKIIASRCSSSTGMASSCAADRRRAVVRHLTMQPWRTIDSVMTPEGLLELRQRGERSCLITIGRRVLMTNDAHRSEDLLAGVACAPLAGRPRPRVLVGGLGMGYTLRAALDALPGAAEVTVVDLNAVVVDWCRGPIAALSGRAIEDPRVKVLVADVAQVIANAPAASLDAIVLDLYEGPHEATSRETIRLYGRAALKRARTALRPGGVLAIWSEQPDRSFAAHLRAAGFAVEHHRGGKGSRSHIIYVGIRRDTPARPRS